MNYILDTNVVSELIAPKPNSNVTGWIDRVDSDQAFISVIAIGELRKGIDKLPQSKRKEMLDQWLREDLLIRFQDYLLPIDADIMMLWGSLNARLEIMGRPISAVDGLLAATAMRYRYTLVTRNSAHFVNTGILLYNPWDE